MSCLRLCLDEEQTFPAPAAQGCSRGIGNLCGCNMRSEFATGTNAGSHFADPDYAAVLDDLVVVRKRPAAAAAAAGRPEGEDAPEAYDVLVEGETVALSSEYTKTFRTPVSKPRLGTHVTHVYRGALIAYAHARVHNRAGRERARTGSRGAEMS